MNNTLKAVALAVISATILVFANLEEVDCSQGVTQGYSNGAEYSVGTILKVSDRFFRCIVAVGFPSANAHHPINGAWRDDYWEEVECIGEVVKVTVTFNPNYVGAQNTNDEVNEGEKVAKPSDPSRGQGFTFAGWFRENTGITPWNFDTDEVTQAVTLFAKWTTTAEFDLNYEGAEVLAPIEVQDRGYLTQPNEPEREGFTFEGWYKDIDGNDPWNFDTDPVTEPTTLYAKWAEEGEEGKDKVDCSQGVMIWSVNGGQSNNGYALGTIVSHEDKFYRCKEENSMNHANTHNSPTGMLGEIYWEEVECENGGNITIKFTVTFKPNYPHAGGTDIFVEVESGQTVEQPETPALPVVEGSTFTFGGWFRENTGITPWNFDTDEVTQATTLYAKWIEEGGENTSVRNAKKSNKRSGIKFVGGNVVKDKAEIKVVDGLITNVMIYDNIGNIVYEGSNTVWDLTNKAGRKVANGTYLVIVEVKDKNGKTRVYSASLGVKN